MVATRPWARRHAGTAPAKSIWARSQPPKMSPLGLVSAGIAIVRKAGSPGGGAAGSTGRVSPAPGRFTGSGSPAGDGVDGLAIKGFLRMGGDGAAAGFK